MLARLPLAGWFVQEALGELTNTPPVVAPEGASNAVTQATTDPSTALTKPGSETDLADAAIKPISTEKPLPPKLKPTAPAAEVVRLAEAGVEEGVMLAFVTNSASTFNLSAEEIIYFNDIGVPGAVVTAMIERDQVIKGSSTGSVAAVAAGPAPAAPAGQFAPTPEVPATEQTPLPPAPVAEGMALESPAPLQYAPADYSLPPAEDGSYSTYYDALAPYGSWVDVAGYGPCWQPTVVVGNPNWQPYFNGGRWVYSDCGWYWLSDYSWGWAPFHYGRWFRHNRMGWCWAPDRVWGPSWVCWRYTADHCGWAPLPPGAHYRPGVGLMFHGKPAGNACGFGLSAHSFAFVGFNHFWDHQLPRHALTYSQANQILNHTVVSTAFVGSNNRVMNNGLPPSRVVAATHTGIHRVAIHLSNVAAAPGVRAERLEAGGNRLSVSQPTWSQRAGVKPASGESMRSGTSKGGGGALAAPTVPGLATSQSLGRSSQTTGTRSGLNQSSVPLADRRAPDATTTARTTTTSSARRPAELNNNSVPAATSPQLSRGADRTAQTGAGIARGNSGTAVQENVPRSALNATGRRESTRSSAVNSSPAPVAQTSPSHSAATAYNSYSRPDMNQRPQAHTPVWSEVQRPSYSTQPSPAPVERHYTAPSYQAPEVSRAAPAPAYAPQHTYSAPAPSYTPRAEVAAPQPSYSAPSAPAASAPAAHSSSSSDKRGR